MNYEAPRVFWSRSMINGSLADRDQRNFHPRVPAHSIAWTQDVKQTDCSPCGLTTGEPLGCPWWVSGWVWGAAMVY